VETRILRQEKSNHDELHQKKTKNAGSPLTFSPSAPPGLLPDIDFMSKVEGKPVNRSDHTQWWDPLHTQPWTATAFEA
jgi:hypothetical protein